MRSEFHRYLSRDLISEIMAELFVRYIIRDNSSYDGKEKTINVRNGFRTYVEMQRVRNNEDFIRAL